MRPLVLIATHHGGVRRNTNIAVGYTGECHSYRHHSRPAELTALRIEKDGYAPSTGRWHAGDDQTLIPLRAVTSLDIEGQYAITFAAAAECTQLPSAVRSRTFTAAISAVPDRRISRAR